MGAAVVQRMAEERVHIILIPKDKKMTDLPEFAYLKDAEALRKANPALYGLLYKIYGPPRDLTS